MVLFMSQTGLQRKSHLKQNEKFLIAALLAAHSSSSEKGFRQKDILFFVELFTNWIEWNFQELRIDIQAVQVKRYLDNLINEKCARSTTRKGRPCFRLTRVGLLELLSRLTSRSERLEPHVFFFCVYILKSYKGHFTRIVEQEGANFPLSAKLELESLLNSDNFIKEEIEFVNKELLKLKARIDDSHKLSSRAQELSKRGFTTEDIAKDVEQRYPYALNSLKPFSELLSALSLEQASWELLEGGFSRNAFLWEPSFKMLSQYKTNLETLLSA